VSLYSCAQLELFRMSRTKSTVPTVRVPYSSMKSYNVAQTKLKQAERKVKWWVGGHGAIFVSPKSKACLHAQALCRPLCTSGTVRRDIVGQGQMGCGDVGRIQKGM